MKEIYTQDTLSQFFKEFQNLPNSFKIEQVHQLLNNPNAKATHKVPSHFKHLNFIIMTSAFIVGVTTLLLLLPKTTNPDVYIDSFSKKPPETVQSRTIGTNVEKEDMNFSDSSVTLEIQEVENNRLVTEISKQDDNPAAIPDNTISNNSTFISDTIEPEEKEENVNGGIRENSPDIVNNAIDALNTIELQKNEYAKLGFLISDNAIHHYSINDECVWKIYFTKSAYGCGIVPLNMVDITKPNFIFLSDQNGFQSIKWRCGNDVGEKWDDEYFKTKIQELIPIVLRKADFPDLLYDDQIFWFEPSVELFNNLPPGISNDLKNEYYTFISESNNIETADTSSSSSNTPSTDKSINCNYFESCKSTLYLESLNIYPNPAKSSITVDFNTFDELEGSIYLFNISGSKLRTLVPNSIFLAGQNSYFIDLSGVEPGIYLVSINTDKGFKTQRIIVSH